MKSSLKNMVLVLFCITLISSACVGLVNMITIDPIAKAKEAAVKEALSQVLPEFDATEKSEHTADELLIIAHKATKGGEVVGYAIESQTKNGFSGLVRLMVGFDTKGVILNVNVLEQAETPGLGTKMCDEGNALISSIKDKDADELEFKVKKEGGELDALTAATISSKAYYDAVARAHQAFLVASGAQQLAEGVSGATTENNEGEAAQEGGKDE
jgi:electron transport complex protein RnfG